MKKAPRCLPARGAATGAQALSQRGRQPGKLQLDPALPVRILQALDNRRNHARIMLSWNPAHFPGSSRRTLNLVMYPLSLIACVVSVTKYSPLKRAPRPAILTRCPARRSGRPMQVPLALTRSLLRSSKIALAPARRPPSELKTGLSTTRSSRASEIPTVCQVTVQSKFRIIERCSTGDWLLRRSIPIPGRRRS